MRPMSRATRRDRGLARTRPVGRSSMRSPDHSGGPHSRCRRTRATQGDRLRWTVAPEDAGYGHGQTALRLEGVPRMTKLTMHEPLPNDQATTPAVVSTGDLPDPGRVREYIDAAYEQYRSERSGSVADYIPALAATSPESFGISVVGVRGVSVEVGDADVAFSIQSVSKPFVFALVCDAIGHRAARDRLGVNSTGFPFNSLMAVELNQARTMNPLVNAGAIATTSLIPGDTAEQKWERILAGLSRFAGRDLHLDREVYESESASNLRNQGIAHLLRSY